MVTMFVKTTHRLSLSLQVKQMVVLSTLVCLQVSPSLQMPTYLTLESERTYCSMNFDELACYSRGSHRPSVTKQGHTSHVIVSLIGRGCYGNKETITHSPSGHDISI